jgi:hypothetical protein
MSLLSNAQYRLLKILLVRTFPAQYLQCSPGHIYNAMRGSPRGGYRGRKPSKPSRRTKQASLQDKDALFSSDSFMRAIAATEDRQEFNRLTSPPAQSQRKAHLPSTNNEYKGLTTRVHEDQEGSPTKGSTTSRRSTSVQDDVFTTTKTPTPATWKRASDQKLPRLDSPSNRVAVGGGFGYSPKTLSPKCLIESQESIPASSDRKLATPEQLFYKTPRPVVSPSPNRKHAARGTLGAQRTVATLAANVDSASNSPTASPEHSSSAASQHPTSDIDTYQPALPSKKARAAGSSARRYDMATLKRWQPANGGTRLAIAQKAALEIEAFQSSQAQSVFGRPAIDVHYARNTIQGFLKQVRKAEHGDNEDLVRGNASQATVDAAEDYDKASLTDRETRKGIYEDKSATAGSTEEDTVEQRTIEEHVQEDDIVEGEGKEVVVDPFKWLLPANFQ